MSETDNTNNMQDNYGNEIVCSLEVHTLAEWDAMTDYVIPEGQLAWAKDSKILKVGNGLLNWKQLFPINNEVEKIGEAPNDGNSYARLNGKWCIIDTNTKTVTYPAPIVAENVKKPSAPDANE